MKPLKLVRLYSPEKEIPMYAVIDSIPRPLGPCIALYADPIPGYIAPTTKIEFVDKVNVKEEELDNNVVLEVEYSSGKDYYVYPKKVWELIKEKYVEPLKLGRPPKDPGLLLHGPPGTGKTTMMMLLSEMLGLYTVNISPDMVVSKYYGETEKNISQKLAEVESHEPSILCVDDAEWLVRSRNLMTAESSQPFLGAMSILLQRLSMWKRSRKKCLMVVATNIDPSNIDPALLRSGRLGKPVFVPLPDVEAVEALLKRKGVSQDKAELYARKLVALGANMADVVAAADDILQGKEPRLEEVRSRGYTRIVPGYTLEKLLRVPKEALIKGRARLWVDLEEPIGVAIVAAALYSLGVSAVLLEDITYWMEAAMTAESSQGVLIVPTSIADSRMHYAARCTIIYVGSRPPARAYRVLSWDLLMRRCNDVTKVIEAVLSYYKIQYTSDVIQKLAAMERSRLKGALIDITLAFGGSKLKEEVLSRW